MTCARVWCYTEKSQQAYWPKCADQDKCNLYRAELLSAMHRDRCRHQTVWLVIMLSSHKVVLVKTDISPCSHTPLHVSGVSARSSTRERTGSKILHVHKVKGLKSHNADKQIRERAVNTSNMYKARLLSAMWWMQTPSDLCGDICFYTCTSVYGRQAESENTHICTSAGKHHYSQRGLKSV